MSVNGSQPAPTRPRLGFLGAAVAALVVLAAAGRPASLRSFSVSFVLE